MKSSAGLLEVEKAKVVNEVEEMQVQTTCLQTSLSEAQENLSEILGEQATIKQESDELDKHLAVLRNQVELMQESKHAHDYLKAVSDLVTTLKEVDGASLNSYSYKLKKEQRERAWLEIRVNADHVHRAKYLARLLLRKEKAEAFEQKQALVAEHEELLKSARMQRFQAQEHLKLAKQKHIKAQERLKRYKAKNTALRQWIDKMDPFAYDDANHEHSDRSGASSPNTVPPPRPTTGQQAAASAPVKRAAHRPHPAKRKATRKTGKPKRSASALDMFSKLRNKTFTMPGSKKPSLSRSRSDDGLLVLE